MIYRSPLFMKSYCPQTSKDPGPNRVRPILLKCNNFILSRPLYFIFNELLRSYCFSLCWKTSFVTSMNKSGDRRNVTNYRPISIVIPKFFQVLDCDFFTQKILYTQVFLLRTWSVVEGAQVPLQHRFLKAFDRVNHSVLIFQDHF